MLGNGAIFMILKKKCQVYEYRPLGCRIYPVAYAVDEGVMTDELCPMRHTISRHELIIRGKVLVKHSKR